MNIREWVDGQPSIFSAIYEESPFKFISLLGIQKLDMMFLARYGNRNIPSYLINLTTKELANMLVLDYYSKWEQYYNVFSTTKVDGNGIVETTNEQVDDDSKRVMSTTTVNKISAFNDDTLSDDNSQEDSVNDDTKKIATKTVEKSIKDYSVLEKQLALFNTGFIETLFTDILKYSALSIS